MMNCKMEVVSPEMAQEFLLHNAGNRSISQKTVALYAREMINGTWAESPEGICFNQRGELIDGQHRLLAVIQSKQPQRMLVITGCPDEATPHLDSGRKRSICDRIRIGSPELAWVTTKSTGICAILEHCFRNTMPTQDETKRFLTDHRDSFMWILQNYRVSEHGLQKASIRAAIMVAYENGVSEKLLTELCEILAGKTVTTKKCSKNFFALKAYLQGRAIRFNAVGGENKTVFFAVAQAIKDTAEGKPLSNLDVRKPFPFKVVGADGQVVYSPEETKSTGKTAGKKKKKN